MQRTCEDSIGTGYQTVRLGVIHHPAKLKVEIVHSIRDYAK